MRANTFNRHSFVQHYDKTSRPSIQRIRMHWWRQWGSERICQSADHRARLPRVTLDRRWCQAVPHCSRSLSLEPRAISQAWADRSLNNRLGNQVIKLDPVMPTDRFKCHLVLILILFLFIGKMPSNIKTNIKSASMHPYNRWPSSISGAFCNDYLYGIIVNKCK